WKNYREVEMSRFLQQDGDTSHFIPILKSFIWDNGKSKYLVTEMPFVKYSGSWFLKNRFTWTEKSWLDNFVGILSVIKTLHANHYLHRDLHLGNVLFDGSKLYLHDFG